MLPPYFYAELGFMVVEPSFNVGMRKQERASRYLLRETSRHRIKFCSSHQRCRNFRQLLKEKYHKKAFRKEPVQYVDGNYVSKTD